MFGVDFFITLHLLKLLTSDSHINLYAVGIYIYICIYNTALDVFRGSFTNKYNTTWIQNFLFNFTHFKWISVSGLMYYSRYHFDSYSATSIIVILINMYMTFKVWAYKLNATFSGYISIFVFQDTNRYVPLMR